MKSLVTLLTFLLMGCSGIETKVEPKPVCDWSKRQEKELFSEDVGARSVSIPCENLTPYDIVEVGKRIQTTSRTILISKHYNNCVEGKTRYANGILTSGVVCFKNQ
jgi:hypothetical protein